MKDASREEAEENAIKALSRYKATERYVAQIGARLIRKNKKVRGVGPREYVTWEQNLAANPELAAEWNRGDAAGNDPTSASAAKNPGSKQEGEL
jgi:hypothetical protein